MTKSFNSSFASSNGSTSAEDKVILAGMGRSGSTLLSNIINCENEFRILFEPFNADQVAEVRDFVYPLYLRPDADDSKFHALASNILEGRIYSPWIDKEKSRTDSSRLLIKDIRINLFLKWLQNHFQGLRIVMLLRHPCAVVQSWLACNFGDGTVARERIFASTQLIKDYVPPNIRREYAKADTAFERLVFFWCLYNQVPLLQFKNKEIIVVFYENLFLDAEAELSRIFTFLRMAPKQAAITKALSTPSSTTTKTCQELALNDKVNGWRKTVSSEQVRRAYGIMSMFGMETLYCPETSAPNISSLRLALGAS